MFIRSSGILLPISALPSRYGIGTLGKEAYKFIDFLHLSGQRYWQLLPIGPVSYGDSPYSSFSTHAGNPYYIDLELLIEDGILTYGDCESLNTDDEYVNYEKQFNLRYSILYNAYRNFNNHDELNKFKEENKWTFDYSLFMAFKYYFNQKPWFEWDEGIKERNERELSKYKELLKNEIEFWTFLQYLFYEQYFKVKSYANLKGVSIIGDIPIYVGEDSAEAWTEKKLFLKNLVAGVPPDAFSETGQLWGNPVYNWGYLKENSYEWWIKRLKYAFKLYDVVRIDHFRGFDEFWAVERGLENAIKGRWLPAYGNELFKEAQSKIGKMHIIAEDLGIITDSVLELKNEFNFPGMKILQFAFDGNPNNPYLPENYEENSVAYTGTHDNDTLKGWFNKLDVDSKSHVLNKLEIKSSLLENEIIEKIIKNVLKSKSKLAVIPLQDYLCLNSRGRINIPSTLGGNWMWRVKKNQLNNELAQKIKQMTIDCNRI